MYQLLAVGDQGCPWMYLCFSSFYLEDVHHSIVYCKHLDSTPVDLRVTDQVSAVLEGQLTVSLADLCVRHKTTPRDRGFLHRTAAL